jgi:hypothetical protein
MSNLKAILVASSLAAFLVSGASAQTFQGTGSELPDGHMIIIPDSGAQAGKLTTKKLGPKKHAAAMKSAKAMPAGTAVYRSGGKLYLVENPKMETGKMLHEYLFDISDE